MPAAIPLIAGAFLAAGTVATALGVTAVAFTVAGLAVSWAAVATITGVALMGVAMLSMKRPKPGSSGGQLDSKLDVRAPIPVAYGRTATGGYITYQQSWGKKNSLLALVAVLSAGPVAGIETHKASDSTVFYSGNPTTGLATSVGVGDGSKLYRNKLRQRYQLGEAPASQTVTQASGLPLPGSPGKLSGLAHTISVLEYDTDAFPQGVPKNVWVLRGVKLYDPRRDSTFPGGSGSHRRDNHLSWEYSENPYLAALDWTFGRWWNGKKVYGIGARFEEVDVAAFVNGANVADANNWKIGGVVTTADNKFAVLSTILQSGGGVPTARGAQLSCTVNAPKTSTFTLSSSDIIGEVEIVNTTTWRDRSNTVVPSYREESQLWAMIAGEQVSSDVYVTEDAGERKTIEVDYPLVQQAAQAHQLATYELCNSREFLTFTVTAKVRALNVRVGDAITVNIPEVAAVSKKCVVISREFNPGDLSVSLTLKSETDDKHSFALGQSQVAPPAPALNGYNPSNPGAPDATAWSATGGEITAPDGSKMPAIIIAGEADDPNASNVIVDYRPAGSSVWLAGGDYPATARTIELTSVTAQTLYDVAVRYRTVRGVVSEPLLLSATAGAQTVNWATVVAGEGKPENDATKGGEIGKNIYAPGTATVLAPDQIITAQGTSANTAKVGTRSATQVVNDIESASGAIAAEVLRGSTYRGETDQLIYMLDGTPVRRYAESLGVKTNDHEAYIAFLREVSGDGTAKFLLSATADGKIVGIEGVAGNGTANQLSFVASRFLFVDDSGNNPANALLYEGGVWKLKNIEVDRIKAKSVTIENIAPGLSAAPRFTAPDTAIMTGETVVIETPAFMVGAFGEVGSALALISFAQDGSATVDTAATIRVYVDTGLGYVMQKNRVSGLRTKDGDTRWIMQVSIPISISSASSARIKVTAEPYSLADRRPTTTDGSYARDIAIDLLRVGR